LRAARNFGCIPGQIADQLRGQKLDSFDDFREEFWKAVGKGPDLSSSFASGNAGRTNSGPAPRAIGVSR
jgi:hypothetical protein